MLLTNRAGRPAVFSVISLAALYGTGAAVLTLAARLERAERRRAAIEAANSAAWGIEQQLAGSLAAAHALAAVVRQAGDDSPFEQVAQGLYRIYSGMDSLQLAPGGVLTRIYPLAGNEAALGLDLAASPIHGDDIRKARATRQLVLAGPFPLKQGGIGLAGRVAVFTNRAGQERYWGVATSLIRLPRLLEASRLNRLSEAGYDYQLSRRTHEGKLQTFASAGSLRAEAVEVSVRVPNGDWMLRVAPRGGWSGGWVLGAHGLLLVVSGAFAFLVSRVLRQPAELRRLVAERSAELELAYKSQQAAEDALRQAQKLETIGLLAGGIAHDFNNLLQVIIGYTEAVATTKDLGPRQREDLTRALAAAERATALTRQMLAFGRRQVLEPAALDLNAVLSEVMKMISRIIGEHIELEVVPARPLASIWADRTQIEQVIVNLCVNARDAMPEGGRLTIETGSVVLDASCPEIHPAGRPGHFVRLSVTDTGGGIPADVVEHVFEPFFTTKEPGVGSGLGLATVHSIVHQHLGWVEVLSEPGRGTTFAVWLPAVDRVAAVEGVAGPGSGSVTGGSETLLVAEDDPAVRALAVRLLREAGYSVIQASDGAEALALASAQRGAIDLALLDVLMPRLGGWEVYRRLQATALATRVVFASGYGEDVVQSDFVKKQGVSLLRKPYGREQLLRAVRTALDAPENPNFQPPGVSG